MVARTDSMIWECAFPPLGPRLIKGQRLKGKRKQMDGPSHPVPWWWQCSAGGNLDFCWEHCGITSQPLCIYLNWKGKLAAAQQLSSEDPKAFNRSGHCKYCPTFLLGGNANPTSVTIACLKSGWNKNLKSQFLYHCCVSGNLLHALRVCFYESIMVME